MLVHGSRPQIEAQLKTRKHRSSYHKGLRVTDPIALECVKEAVGLLRVEIDALLSLGLPSTPMAGAAINTVSGNFISARPMGVHDGVDYQHTGQRAQGRRAGDRRLPRRGEHRRRVADRLLADRRGVQPRHGGRRACDGRRACARRSSCSSPMPRSPSATARSRPELTAQEAEKLLADGRHLSRETRAALARAVAAVRAGVERAHVVPRDVDGALLIELFTHAGSGSMLTADKLERLREATIDDVGGILRLIEPLEADGTLVRRGRELLEQEISRFTVLEHDRLILGCAALYPFPKARAGELACLAVHPDYRGAGHGEKIMDAIAARARAAGMKRLFVLTTRATHWFVERGFSEADVERLPAERKLLYNWQRRSKVLVRPLKLTGGSE